MHSKKLIDYLSSYLDILSCYFKFEFCVVYKLNIGG